MHGPEGAPVRQRTGATRQLAEEAGHEGPHRMQGLLRRYEWSWEKLRDALPGLAAQCLPDDPDDLIGPGTRSAGRRPASRSG